MLIVEDDAALNAALVRSMQRNGFDVISCNDTESALQTLAKEHYDYAVFDLKIGQGSGLDLLPLLLQRNPEAKALVLTGYSSIATAVDAIKLCAINYLCKPASTQQILDAFNIEATSTVSTITPAPSVQRLEWEHIQTVLSKNDNNISATARELGMHRRTLQRKLQKRPVKH